VSVAGLSGPAVVREIVGVARQVKGRADETDDFAQLYIPNTQDTSSDAYLLVRAADGPAGALAQAIRAAMSRADRDVRVGSMRTLEDIATVATSRYRFRAVLVATFAALSLVLAMVGVFGVLAYSVQRRTREFGVRMALGASMASVLGLVLGSATRVIAVGAVIGLGAAAALAQSISAFLFGVEPIDPVTFGSVALLVAATALVAIAAPAFRAARVDPAVAFRQE
jgi:putative ABC transport system permease protein